MKMALIGSGTNLECGPEAFTEKQIKLSREKGVLLKVQNSKTAEMSYLANTCPKCDAFIGEWFYFAHYFAPAMYGQYDYEEVANPG